MTSVVLNYHKHINRNEVQFDYLYMSEYEPNYREEILSLGGRVYHIPFRKGAIPSLGLQGFFFEHRGEYQVLHCHPIFGAQMLGCSARLNGVEHIIAHSHSTRYSNKPASERRNKLLTKVVGLFATDYAACSIDAARLFGPRAKQAHIIRNAIECREFRFDKEARDRIRTELGISKNTILLGNIGRLECEKNQAFLLQVCKELRLSDRDYKLAIVGGGTLKGLLEGSIRENDLEEYVTMLGVRTDVSALYSAFDIFLLPSLFEGFPVSAVEAQASGLPCLFSDTVTHEALITRGDYVSIKDGFDPWIRAIDDMQLLTDEDRTLQNKKVIDAGYDIRREAVELTDYYVNLVNS